MDSSQLWILETGCEFGILVSLWTRGLYLRYSWLVAYLWLSIMLTFWLAPLGYNSLEYRQAWPYVQPFLLACELFTVLQALAQTLEQYPAGRKRVWISRGIQAASALVGLALTGVEFGQYRESTLVVSYCRFADCWVHSMNSIMLCGIILASQLVPVPQPRNLARHRYFLLLLCGGQAIASFFYQLQDPTLCAWGTPVALTCEFLAGFGWICLLSRKGEEPQAAPYASVHEQSYLPMMEPLTDEALFQRLEH